MITLTQEQKLILNELVDDCEGLRLTSDEFKRIERTSGDIFNSKSDFFNAVYNIFLRRDSAIPWEYEPLTNLKGFAVDENIELEIKESTEKNPVSVPYIGGGIV